MLNLSYVFHASSRRLSPGSDPTPFGDELPAGEQPMPRPQSPSKGKAVRNAVGSQVPMTTQRAVRAAERGRHDWVEAIVGVVEDCVTEGALERYRVLMLSRTAIYVPDRVRRIGPVSMCE